MPSNNLRQIVAGVIIVSSAVVSFLLVGQSDIVFDPVIKVVLGAANVALTTLGLYLNVRMPGQSSTG